MLDGGEGAVGGAGGEEQGAAGGAQGGEAEVAREVGQEEALLNWFTLIAHCTFCQQGRLTSRIEQIVHPK